MGFELLLDITINSKGLRRNLSAHSKCSKDFMQQILNILKFHL